MLCVGVWDRHLHKRRLHTTSSPANLTSLSTSPSVVKSYSESPLVPPHELPLHREGWLLRLNDFQWPARRRARSEARTTARRRRLTWAPPHPGGAGAALQAVLGQQLGVVVVRHGDLDPRPELWGAPLDANVDHLARNQIHNRQGVQRFCVRVVDFAVPGVQEGLHQPLARVEGLRTSAMDAPGLRTGGRRGEEWSGRSASSAGNEDSHRRRPFPRPVSRTARRGGT